MHQISNINEIVVNKKKNYYTLSSSYGDRLFFIGLENQMYAKLI
jgi:hypothetical protein